MSHSYSFYTRLQFRRSYHLLLAPRPDRRPLRQTRRRRPLHQNRRHRRLHQNRRRRHHPHPLLLALRRRGRRLLHRARRPLRLRRRRHPHRHLLLLRPLRRTHRLHPHRLQARRRVLRPRTMSISSGHSADSLTTMTSSPKRLPMGCMLLRQAQTPVLHTWRSRG